MRIQGKCVFEKVSNFRFLRKRDLGRLRCGFTLVELLVVITIIAILIALLLPAIQAAREASRQAQCKNNLKQLALGLVNYEATMRTFPPAITPRSGQNAMYPGITQPGQSLGPSWIINVLPFLEQEALYRSFDLNVAISDSSNIAARSTPVGMLLCPSDVRKNQLTLCEWNNGNWARGNYACNGDQAFATSTATWENHFVKGVMGVARACSIDDIRDGTSSTVLLVEIRAGLRSIDRRGTWAMGVCGASSVFQHAAWNLSPNWCTGNNGTADAAVECTMLADPSTGPGAAVLIKECMPCSTPGAAGLHSGAANPRSRHAGGVNAAFCDGSVRFVSEYIENGHYGSSGVTAPVSQVLTWQRINLSNDGMVVDGNKF